MEATSITLDRNTFDSLYKSKQFFEEIVGHKLKWWEFIRQTELVLQAYYTEPPILAQRYNKYIYAANCPSCHKTNGPLHRQKAIIWKINCECGTEYIAVP